MLLKMDADWEINPNKTEAAREQHEKIRAASLACTEEINKDRLLDDEDASGRVSRNRFKLFDQDGNGRISKYEFRLRFASKIGAILSPFSWAEGENVPANAVAS